MNKFKYTYLLVRYIHDSAREESVNVGLLFYSPDQNFIRFGVRDNLKELRVVFADLKADRLRRYLKEIEGSFTCIHNRMLNELPLQKSNIVELAHKILPQDDSSVQWGKEGSGISDDLEKTYESIAMRFVQNATDKTKYHHSRSDKQVWTKFSRELERRNLLSYFKPKTLTVGGFTEEYEHTYMNGKLHCLKPVSFDLKNEENIRDKVYKESGRTIASSANKDGPDVVFYFLLGKPSNPELLDDFKYAKEILENAKDSVVFTEEEASSLPDYLEKNVHLHG